MVIADPAAELLRLVTGPGDPPPLEADPTARRAADLIRRRFGLDSDAGAPLSDALARGAVSARGADRVVRVAWTVADLAGRDRPSLADVGTALLHRDGGSLWAA